jgi:hypothetical protein
MDSNMIDAILASGENDPQAAELARQQKQIEMLRGMSMRQPQQQMAGGVLLPNFGQVGGNMMAGYQASRMEPGAREMESGVNSRALDARRRTYDNLIMALRKPYPEQPGVMLPPSGMEDQ